MTNKRIVGLIVAITLLFSQVSVYATETVEAVQTELGSEDPAEGDKANSWRYVDGERMHPYGTRAAFYTTWPEMEYAVANGIDVSKWNGDIDWAKAKAAGVEYAIIRCGYGSNLTKYDDTYWKTNADACTKLGIPFGTYIYSYADSLDDAVSEAEHVLRLIKGYNLDYPVYYDLEDDCITENLTKSEIAQLAETFCSIIEDAGYEVGIYANTYWFTSILTDPVFDKWDRWVAQYNTNCTYAGNYTMWQCSASGVVDGIDGVVDLNIEFDWSEEEGVQYFEDGLYTIKPNADNGSALSVSNSSLVNMANVQVEPYDGLFSQQFALSYQGDGYYKITAEHSGKRVDIAYGSNAEGANVQQYEEDGSAVQYWKFIQNEDGSFYIKSKVGTVMDVNGTNIQMSNMRDVESQKWEVSELPVEELRPIEDGNYTIINAASKQKVLTEKDGNIQLNLYENIEQQKYDVTYISGGYYKITEKDTNMVLAVQDASTYNGANLLVEEENDLDSQLWRIGSDGNGNYYLKSKLGTFACTKNASRAENTNIQMTTYNKRTNSKWRFSSELAGRQEKSVQDGTYVLRSGLDKQKVVAVKNTSSAIQIDNWEGTSAQKIELSHIRDGYYRVLFENSGKALTVGTSNVYQSPWKGNDGQLWKIIKADNGVFYLKSKLGKVLSLSGNSAVVGTSLRVSAADESMAQIWNIENMETYAVKTGTYTIQSYQSSSKVLDLRNRLKLYNAQNTTIQKFKVNHVDGGFYKITSVKTGKALTMNGSYVTESSWRGANNQLWKFVSVGNGSYYIRSKEGMTMSVANGKLVNAADIQMINLSGVSYQKWKLKLR